MLRHIARDGSRVTELAERARMTKQSMAQLVDALRERGYAELAPDPSDGRAKLVRLTERGWQLHDALVAISREFEADRAREMGEETWRRLRGLLEELTQLLGRERGRPAG
ncbi:Winged helix DNA-binding domain-containing protein [Tistlia consotensis]|uniref:Winged helix DNA-binding domain-containing protein n=1 Tax=Tistlia consotensis USBA 355 TaxID=560819 RepID=A0A1Y6CD99_9PROT|nr:Winged helix DNA-binding domain-containing protein [Tistlia consotensis USBA 355]SNR45196.1 Winged helix DNA-binding domain-containing protein [Tistlia consotensis]